MSDLLDLPVRVTDDLRVEVDPDAQLTPDQGLHVAERLIAASIRRRLSDALSAPTPSGRRVRKRATA